MENKSPSELAQMLIEAGFAKTGPFVGCSIEDLSELEKRFSVTLPRAYKEFMIVMGQESGNFLLDGSWHYPLEWNQSTAEGMLQENDSDFVLEKDTFVFMARDNFFIFFYTNAGDDPPVYIFEDGAKQPRKFFGSFSEWLTVCVTEDVRSRTKNELAKQERTRSDDGPTVPEKIVELLLVTGRADSADIVGCTDEQIAEIESKFAVGLPSTYKHFLRVMGYSAGQFFADCSWKFSDLPHAQEVLAQKLLETEHPVELPKSRFVFLACSAAEILFFDTTVGDDPPVYLLEIASEPPKLWSKSFSDWLSKAAKEVAKMSPNPVL